MGIYTKYLPLNKYYQSINSKSRAICVQDPLAYVIIMSEGIYSVRRLYSLVRMRLYRQNRLEPRYCPPVIRRPLIKEKVL